MSSIYPVRHRLHSVFFYAGSSSALLICTFLALTVAPCQLRGALFVTNSQSLNTTTIRADNQSGVPPSASLEGESDANMVELTVASQAGNTFGTTFAESHYSVFVLDPAILVEGQVFAKASSGGSDPDPRALADVRTFYDFDFTLTEAAAVRVFGEIRVDVHVGDFFPQAGQDFVTYGLEIDGGPFDVRSFPPLANGIYAVGPFNIPLAAGTHHYRASFAAVTEIFSTPSDLSDAQLQYRIALEIPEPNSVWFLLSIAAAIPFTKRVFRKR